MAFCHSRNNHLRPFDKRRQSLGDGTDAELSQLEFSFFAKLAVGTLVMKIVGIHARYKIVVSGRVGGGIDSAPQLRFALFALATPFPLRLEFMLMNTGHHDRAEKTFFFGLFSVGSYGMWKEFGRVVVEEEIFTVVRYIAAQSCTSHNDSNFFYPI